MNYHEPLSGAAQSASSILRNGKSSGTLRSTLDDPNFIDKIIEFRRDQTGGTGLDPMDEFSNHYAMVCPEGNIRSSIMMTRLGANTAYIEDQLDPLLPEILRPRAVFAGFLVSKGGYADFSRVIVGATAAEIERGARFACMLIQPGRVRPYQRFGLISTTHGLIQHPRTENHCTLMVAICGLTNVRSPMYKVMEFWPEIEEFESHKDYFQQIGVSTELFRRDSRYA